MTAQDVLTSLREGCRLLEGPALDVVDAGQRLGRVDVGASARRLVLARPDSSLWEEIQVVGDSTGKTIELAFMPPETDAVPLRDLILALGEPTEVDPGFDAAGRSVQFASAEVGNCEVEARLRRAPDEEWKAVMLTVSLRAGRG